MRLSRFPIGRRLGAVLAGLCVLLALVAGTGAVALKSLNATVIDNDDAVERYALTVTMSEQTHVVARVMRTVILLDDDTAREAELAKIVAARQAYDEAWRTLQTLAPGEKARRLRADIEAATGQARAVNDRVLALARADDDGQALALLLAESIPATQRWQDALEANMTHLKGRVDGAGGAAQAVYRQGLAWMVGVALASLLLAAVLGVLLTRSIVRPITYVRDCALRMAGGDLTVRVERREGFQGRDETSQLVEAMQRMHDSMCEMVTAVQASASGVAGAAQQIAAGNVDLSARTEQQASSLQQTAATMHELTHTVQANTQTTVQAAEFAQGAGAVAGRGGEVMARVVSTMRQIDAGSQRIADIIGSIDGIAFQTNILALNAAVEAARAGDAGRGFAVVAAEVRTLAQRSAGAAREIKQLIGSSVEQVGAGTALVEQAGTTMAEIVGAIERMRTLMDEIRHATTEQSTGITQVGTAVQQMDQVTQQNSALVEESAAAAASLSQQAQDLLVQVGRFRLAAAAGH
jgi:methyl-accepting chemotaxis protein